MLPPAKGRTEMMTKRKPDLHPTTALKLHSFGLQRLHDPNWTGITLFDELKQHVRGRREPTTILFRAIENGLLFHLGLWLYREYFQDESFVEGLGGEYLAWYLEDCLNFLRHHHVPDRSAVLDRLDQELRRIDAMFDKSEDRYWDYLESEQGEGVGRLRTHWERIQRSFRNRIEGLAPLYAGD